MLVSSLAVGRGLVSIRFNSAIFCFRVVTEAREWRLLKQQFDLETPLEEEMFGFDTKTALPQVVFGVILSKLGQTSPTTAFRRFISRQRRLCTSHSVIKHSKPITRWQYKDPQVFKPLPLRFSQLEARTRLASGKQ